MNDALEFSRDSVRLRVAALLSSGMELCNDQHPHEHAEMAVGPRSTTSTNIFSCLIIVLVFLGMLAVEIERTMFRGRRQAGQCDGACKRAHTMDL